MRNADLARHVAIGVLCAGTLLAVLFMHVSRWWLLIPIGVAVFTRPITGSRKADSIRRSETCSAHV